MKRLLILLIVLAGGLTWASLSVPTNAASVNGVTISQSSLTAEITAVANSKLYACFLNGEQLVATQGQDAVPPVNGVGLQSSTGPYTAANTAFVSSFLNTEIGHDIVDQLAAERHLTPNGSDLATARTELNNQVGSVLQELQGSQYACTGAAATVTGSDVLNTMPASFVNNLVRFDATISLLEEDLSGVGTSAAALQRYFYEHHAEFETACFTVAGYSSLADAQAAIAKVNAGTPFATVAAQVSGGGPRGCDILYGVANSLPAGNGLQTLPINQVSAPIVEGSAYLVVEITSRTQTPFATALSQVRSAVQSAGSAKARTAITAAEHSANVRIDPRFGTWTPAEVAVVPPTAPDQLEVLDPTVNSQAAATAPTTSASGTSG